MKKTIICAALILLLFVSARSASSQVATPEGGANPYKSYSGGDIDHIQMQNGGLYLQIPLLSYPQLGKLKLSFSLLANEPQYYMTSTCDTIGDCYFGYDFSPPAGPCDSQGGNPFPQIVLDQDLNLSSCFNQALEQSWCAQDGGYCINDSWVTYQVVDSTGAAHPLGYNQNNWSTLQATDGSGYTVQMPWANSLNAATSPPGNTCGGSTTVYDSSGVKYTAASTCEQDGVHQTPLSTTISDPIGNTIVRQIAGSNGVPTSIQDSVGRMIPDPTGWVEGWIYGQSYPWQPGPGLVADPDTSNCPNLHVPGESVQYSMSWKVPGYQGAPGGPGNVTYHLCYSSAHIVTQFFGGGTTNDNCVYMYYYGNSLGAVGSTCINYGFQDINTVVPVLQSVVLPNKTYWGFVYDTSLAPYQASYGDLLQVIMPTGGSLNYTYSMINVCAPASNIPFAPSPQGRAVASRTLNPLLGPSEYKSYQYDPWARTIETDGEGNDTVHNFTFLGTDPCGAEEGSTQWYQGSSNGGTGGTVLKEVGTGYTYQVSPQDGPDPLANLNYQTNINVLPSYKVTALNGQLASEAWYTYDTLFTDSQPFANEWTQATGVYPTTSPILYGMPTSVYDGIQTKTTSRYAVDHPAYQAANLLDLPEQVTTYDTWGVNNHPVALTTYRYDENEVCPGPFGNQQVVAGNATSVLQGLSSGPQTLQSAQYNCFGMPTHKTDANGNTTSFTYDTSNNLYVTEVQMPPTNSVAHNMYYKQDFNTGLLTAMADENASGITDTGHLTTFGYDSMGRLSNIQYPPGGGSVTQCYTDEPGGSCQGSAPYSMIITKAESASQNITSRTGYDGVGRPVQTELQSGPAGPLFTDTQYDDLGHVHQVSNPYHTSADPTYGWTSFTYDVIGRKLTQQTHPDGDILQWTYTGNMTDSEDELGRHTQRTTDIRGRLVQVMEPDPGTGVPSLETDYGYDALDNLTSVSQLGNAALGEAARTRSFTYDGLSRLSTSTNPESGTLHYSYDLNGNLTQKIAPAPNASSGTVTLGYSYDALNRLCYKFYQAPTAAGCPATPPSGAVASYAYDVSSISGAQNTNGKLTAEATLSSSGAPVSADFPYNYDAMGRMQAEQQCPISTCYTLAYTYDYAGNVTSSTNGMTGSNALSFTYGYDTAAHLTSVLSGATPLFQALQTDAYGPAGLVKAELGVGAPGTSVAALFTTRAYDSRMRLVSETDTANPTAGTGSGTGSTGNITVTGTEHVATALVPATATLTVTKPGLYFQVCVTGSSSCTYIGESEGYVVIMLSELGTPAGWATFGYTAGESAAALAGQIATALTSSTSPVTATATGSTVTLTSAAGYNYAIEIDSPSAYYDETNGDYASSGAGDLMSCSAAAAFALTGGAVATPADVGTVTALVDGVQSVVPWGAADSASSIAHNLATAITANSGGQITATPSGSGTNYTIQLNSTATGAATNSPVTVTVEDTTPGLSPSFAFTPTPNGMSGGTDAGTPSGGSPVYSYNLAGDFAANGDLLAYSDSVMGSWAFGYDKLDRLTSAAGPSSQSMSYAYDSFGNRWPTNQRSATSWSQFTTANQVPANNGVVYDAAGNVTSMAGLHSFVYDDENRVASVDGSTSYLYDAEGNRVAKGSWSGSTFIPSAVYLLGPGNTQVTELDGSGAWKHSNVYAAGKMLATYDSVGLHYQLADWEGTRRVQTSGSGAIEEMCSSYPFGDNLSCTGSGNDATEQHFTGKQRDTESGNDYFKYRYYASTTGRWLSPDPSKLTYADLGNPQSLNLYNYVGNNPLIRIDLEGLCWRGFQWACKLGQAIDNGFHGLGFHTDATVDRNVHNASQKLRQAGVDSDRMTRRQVLRAANNLNCGATGNVGITAGVAIDVGDMYRGKSLSSTTATSGQVSLSLSFYYDNSNPSSPGNIQGILLSSSTAALSSQPGGNSAASPSQNEQPSVMGAYAGTGAGITWGTAYGPMGGTSQTATINTSAGSISGSESQNSTQASATVGGGALASANNVTTNTTAIAGTGPCAP
jgi:RHS repeat-associated protein